LETPSASTTGGLGLSPPDPPYTSGNGSR
jgi:hypothetical protein